MKKETSRLPRERPASVLSLSTAMEDGEKDEEMKPRGEAWEMRVRDIPGDEREGLSPEKML